MLKVWAYSIVSVVFVSLLSLIGVFTLSLNQQRLRKVLLFLISFAVGGLYGDAFIHLIPESFKKLGMTLETSLLVLAGVLLFFVIEKVIRRAQEAIVFRRFNVKPMVTLNILVDAVHNMIDGMLIGASFMVSIPIGITTTLAVVFHEIPHEIGDFAILVHGGLTVRRALFFNFLSALTAVAGGVLSLLLGPTVQDYSIVVLPITAGGFIYIAGSDLIPELQQNIGIKTSLVQLLMVLSGVGIMALLLFFS
jgi:zinc and cadmium transporter